MDSQLKCQNSVPTMREANISFLPFLAACAGIGLFSLMDAVMKGLALSIGAFDAVLWRNVAGAALMLLPWLAFRKAWPSRDAMRLHLTRSFIVAWMALAFFWALTQLPLAEAIGLSFVAPVIALFLAAILLGERIGREAIIASLFGLAGVAVMLSGRIGGERDEGALWGALAVLGSAFLFAWNLVLARRQAQIAEPLEIAFFQSALTAMFLLPLLPLFGSVPAPDNVPSIGAAALLAAGSLILLSWAYARAEAQYLIPVEYTAFGWAALFGWLFFVEPVTPLTLAGTALIVAGSIIAARARKPAGLPKVDAAAI